MKTKEKKLGMIEVGIANAFADIKYRYGFWKGVSVGLIIAWIVAWIV